MHDEHLEQVVAVVGLAGRFPGASTVEDFWSNLRAGRESISFLSEQELRAAGVPEKEWRQPGYVPAKGVLADIAGFDAAFFDISPREASLMDPQHRIFLEICVEAFERAGIRYDDERDRTGVFAGVSKNTYLYFNLLSHPELRASPVALQTLIGNEKDYLSTRVSYKLGLTGPSMTIQTACSSSLVAVHMACQSLLSGDCELALAGGVTADVPHRAGYMYEPGGILSPDGHCRAFDASARGTVFSQGAGAVLLKLLPDALEDGNEIHALIRASAVNNDGANKVGFTAPSVSGQEEVVADALLTAGVDVESITYVEAHGTGTPLGDPIEVEALTRAFRRFTPLEGFCRIGSVKTNVGHLNAAAGIAGLIKTVLALQRHELPPSLHFERPNPHIPFIGSPFMVCDRLTPWENRNGPLRAGVSSFGIGGTNAHAVLEEAPASPRPARVANRPWRLVVTSARTPSALLASTRALGHDLAGRGDGELDAVSYTLQTGRRAFSHRAAVVCRDMAGAAHGLMGFRADPAATFAHESASVAFVFSGQGSQYPGMARELHCSERVFRETFEQCCEELVEAGAHDPRTLLGASPSDLEASKLARRTEIAQPALYAVEYALARLWQSWGIVPAALAGHSIGEIVAARVAGIFDGNGAARLVAERARLAGMQPEGAMLAVGLPADQLRRELPAEVEIAAVNAPDLTSLSGPPSAIELIRDSLCAAGVAVQRLHTSHAFHSAAMDAAVAPLSACAATIARKAPSVPLFSNVTGDRLTDDEALDPGYWGRQLRCVVRFSDCAGALLRTHTAMLEIGPGRTLGQLIRRHPDFSRAHLVVRSLPDHAESERDDRKTMLEALGRLWAGGAEPRWEELHEHSQRRSVALPTYPFERARHWIEHAAAAPAATETRSLEVIQRVRHTRPAAEQSPANVPAPAASRPTAIASVFEELLGLSDVRDDDDFFELGGNSMLGAELAARLREVLGAELPLRAVFRDPRPSALAALASTVVTAGDEHEAYPQGDVWLAQEPIVTRPRGLHGQRQAILLTGATGFLGVFLLRELLRQTVACVRCLVRCDQPDDGSDRLHKALLRYGLADEVDMSRIEVLAGDLSRDRFGLEAGVYAELMANCASIVHNGAKVSFLEPYGRLRDTNVHGTREVLRLAMQAGGIPVHHVSSIAVFDCDAFEALRTAGEDEDLSVGHGFHCGYDESKWVAEQLVQLARRQGLPASVYRPGNISGHSLTGAVSKGHLIPAMLRGCIALGLAPDSGAFVNLVPVDYVSSALVALSLNPKLQGSNFHLVNPTAIRWTEIVERLRTNGYELELAPLADWIAAIREASDDSNPLRVFVPMLEERALFSGRRYRAENTRAALAKTGIACPQVDDTLMTTYLRELTAVHQ